MRCWCSMKKTIKNRLPQPHPTGRLTICKWGQAGASDQQRRTGWYLLRAAQGTTGSLAAGRLSRKSLLWRASDEGGCSVIELRNRTTVGRSWARNTAQGVRSSTSRTQRCDEWRLTGLIAAVNCFGVEDGGPVALLHHGQAGSGIVAGMLRAAPAKAPVVARLIAAWCVFLAKSSLCLHFFRHDVSEGEGKVIG